MKNAIRLSGFLAVTLALVACSSSDEAAIPGGGNASEDAGSSGLGDGGSGVSGDGGVVGTKDGGPTTPDGGPFTDAGLNLPDGGTSAYPYGVYGSYKPGPTTTGVRAGTTLIPYTNQFGAIVNGVLTLSTAGVTISGYDIPAYIVVKADKITIENSRVHGPATIPTVSVSHNLVTAYDVKATNLVVRDCTLFATAPDHNSQGLQGKSFTAERNDVYDVVDGIDPLNDGSVILANWIHDLAWFSPDSNHTDNHSHNDCVQLEGGSATIRFNNLEGFLSKTAGDGAARPYDQSNSVFQITDATSPATTNLVIDHNWLDGGQVAVNVGGTAYTSLGTLSDNVFGDNQAYDGVTILLNATRASMGLTITGNEYGACDLPLHTASRNGTTVDTGNGVHGG